MARGRPVGQCLTASHHSLPLYERSLWSDDRRARRPPPPTHCEFSLLSLSPHSYIVGTILLRSDNARKLYTILVEVSSNLLNGITQYADTYMAGDVALEHIHRGTEVFC